MKIITISREFGSGGRELGKRLSDSMGLPYYDREIITAIAQKNSLDENYVESALEKGVIGSMPLTFGRTFTFAPVMPYDTTSLLIEQQKVVKKLAQKGDCIIVGRNADVILEQYNPLKIFVYADMDAKLKRCMERSKEEEPLKPQDMQKKIKQIDKARSNHHAMLAKTPWGNKAGYHLCINTTGLEIKNLASVVADYANFWFHEGEQE